MSDRSSAHSLPEHRHLSDLHVSFLDSVRGLAAMTVLCEHYVISFELPTHDVFWRKAWDYSPLHIFWDGSAAVSLFFVLSGLVLSLKHFRSTSQPDLGGFNLPMYLVGRCFRLCPPYLAALLVSAIGYALTTGPDPLLSLNRQSLWLDELWGHAVDWRGMIGEANLMAMPKQIVIVPQSWTLTIELLISFLVPLGILLAGRSSLWLVIFVCVAIKLLDAPTVLFHFAFGILLAKYYQTAMQVLPLWPLLRRALLLAGILLYTVNDTWAGQLSGDWGAILSAVGAGLILLYVIGSERAKQWLTKPVLRYIGRVSFSFYLLHMLVLFCVMPWVWLLLRTSPMESVWVWWFGLAFSIAVSLGFAAAAYRWVEVPSMAAGKAVTRWLEKTMGEALALPFLARPVDKVSN